MNSLNWQGNLYLSDAPIGSESKPLINNPVCYDPNDPNYRVRYQYIKFTGGENCANLSIDYSDWYSVTLVANNIVTNISKGQPSGSPTSDNIKKYLADLSKSNPEVVVFGHHDNLARVISPTAHKSFFQYYPSFDNYIKSVFSNVATENILIQNIYEGVYGKPGDNYATQSYSSKFISYDEKVLTIIGATSLMGEFEIVANIDIEQFNHSLYFSTMNYSWATGNNNNKHASTNDMDVFSFVVRDLLAGFAFGFIESTEFLAQASQEWQKADIGNLFSIIQPSNAFFNPWANILNTQFNPIIVLPCFYDVNTFPLNNFLTNFAPLLQVAPTQTVVIDWVE